MSKKSNPKKEESIQLPLFLNPNPLTSKDIKSFGGILKDLGQTALNTALLPAEMLVGKNFYDPSMETDIGAGIAAGSNLVGDIGSSVLPAVANQFLPGSGTVINAVQQGTNGLIEDNTQHSVFQNQQQAQNVMGGIGAIGMALPLLTGQPMQMANGGPLEMTQFNGPAHEQGGIAVGPNAEVEGGEVRVEDYIFSDRLTNAEGKTFAEVAKSMDKKYGLRKNDAPSNRAKKKELEILVQENEGARVAAEQKQAELAQADAQMFAQDVQYKNGGYYVNPSKRAIFVKTAKERGMSVEDYAKSVADSIQKYCMGGKMKYAEGGFLEGGDEKKKDPYWYPSSAGGNYASDLTELVTRLGSSGQIPTDGYERLLENIRQGKYADVQGEIDGLYKPKSDEGIYNPPALEEMNVDDTAVIDPFAQYVSNDSLSNLPKSSANSTNYGNYVQNPNSNQNSGSNFFDPNAKFGAKEAGLLASNAAGVYNIIKGMNPAETEFERFTPETIDLARQRESAERDTAVGRAIQGYNVRNNATSSGQALSNLAAGNSALTNNLIQNKLSSFLNEETTNAQIRNNAGAMNTQIANNEIIANEQNKAMADSLIGLGLSDIGQNTQGYLRDKGLQQENRRYNDQTFGIINQLFPNYQWGKDPANDQYMINFVLPKISQ